MLYNTGDCQNTQNSHLALKTCCVWFLYKKHLLLSDEKWIDYSMKIMRLYGKQTDLP